MCNVQPTFNNIDLQDLISKVEQGQYLIVTDTLSEYDKDLIQLHEQCRKCELTSYGLFIAIDTLANKHVIHAKRVIADLFAR